MSALITPANPERTITPKNPHMAPRRKPIAPPSHRIDEDSTANTAATAASKGGTGNHKNAIVLGGIIGLTLLGAAGFFVSSNNTHDAAVDSPANQAAVAMDTADTAQAPSPNPLPESSAQPVILNPEDAEGLLANLIHAQADNVIEPSKKTLKQAIPNFGGNIAKQLVPTYDTYITSVEPGTTFETDTVLRVLGANDYNQVAYLRFDLSGVDLNNVINAALVLTESEKSYARTPEEHDNISVFAAVLKDGAPQEYQLLSGMNWNTAFGLKTGKAIQKPEHFEKSLTEQLGNLTYLDQGLSNQFDDGDIWYLSNRNLFEAVRNQSKGNQSLTIILATSAAKHLAFHSMEANEENQPKLLIKYASE